MAKIIPWSLPSIAGGSQGGYTPAPTPEPELVYDLSEVVVSRYTPAYGSSSWYLAIQFSGITIENLVGLNSIQFVSTVRLSPTSQADADTQTAKVITRTIPTSFVWITNPNSWITLVTTEALPTEDWYYVYYEQLVVNMLDANGTILQSETIDLTGLNE